MEVRCRGILSKSSLSRSIWTTTPRFSVQNLPRRHHLVPVDELGVPLLGYTAGGKGGKTYIFAGCFPDTDAGPRFERCRPLHNVGRTVQCSSSSFHAGFKTTTSVALQNPFLSFECTFVVIIIELQDKIIITRLKFACGF